MVENPIIELSGLTRNYGKVKAVNDLNLQINKGEVFGLLGPNGAGKTTTILMMLGLSEPSSGTANVCGINATTHPIEVKRKVGYMPDSVGFYDNMTALENLLYIGRLNGIPEQEVEERARQTMEMVGLGGEMNKKTSAYSRGMKQRLGLADVLIRDPEIIILDEPTLGIDPSGVKEFLYLIRNLSRKQGLTVLLCSHHLHQVQQVCDRVGIFVGGKLLVEGTIETLSHELFGEDTFTVVVTLKETLPATWQPLEELRRLDGVNDIKVNGRSLEFSCSKELTPQIVRFLVTNGQDITGVNQKEFGLDEIYQQYFENNLEENISEEKRSGFFRRSFFKKNSK